MIEDGADVSLVIEDQKDLEKSGEVGESWVVEDEIVFARAHVKAVFYPKFENEWSSKQIRGKMIGMVSDGLAILEVSLKHSGSLFMYAGQKGGSYAKNSYDNIYTAVGSFVLECIFHEAWGIKAAEKQIEFDDFLENNHLCVSMELVTAVLGDHGQRPRADYVVVTAIAELGHGEPTFYSTPDIIAFCQIWRLPSNHVWLFSTSKSVTSFFAAYDKLWEEGTATTVCSTLDRIADISVPGTADHRTMQGEILEGLVARVVCYDSKSRMEEVLRNFSFSPFEDVGFELGPNLREIFNTKESEAQILETLLKHIRYPFCPDYSVSKLKSSCHDISTTFFNNHPDLLTTFLNAHPVDFCTKKLQEMICVMDETTKKRSRIDFKFYLQKTDMFSTKDLQLNLVIHVRNDLAFRHYQEKMRCNPELWPLYRGFFVGLNIWKGNKCDASENILNINNTLRCFKAGDDAIIKHTPVFDGVNMMIKLKFLPYKLRTFFIRDGLSKLFGWENVESYRKYCLLQMKKWGTSPQKQNELMQMLDDWAQYVMSKYKKDEFPTRTYLGEAEPFLERYRKQSLENSVTTDPVCSVEGDALLPMAEHVKKPVEPLLEHQRAAQNHSTTV